MTRKGLLMSSKDNVIVVLEDCNPGDTVIAEEQEVQISQPVTFGHKIASAPISLNQDVLKYGEVIGYALEDIEKGTWIHNHNMGCHRGKK